MRCFSPTACARRSSPAARSFSSPPAPRPLSLGRSRRWKSLRPVAGEGIRPHRPAGGPHRLLRHRASRRQGRRAEPIGCSRSSSRRSPPTHRPDPVRPAWGSSRARARDPRARDPRARHVTAQTVRLIRLATFRAPMIIAAPSGQRLRLRRRGFRPYLPMYGRSWPRGLRWPAGTHHG